MSSPVSLLPAVRPADSIVHADKLSIFVSEHGLSVQDKEQVVYMITEYSSNLPTIERMLGWGITLANMGSLFEARQTLESHGLDPSLTKLHELAARFSCMSYDSAVMTEQVLKIRDNYDPEGKKFIGTVLSRVIRAADKFGIEDPVYMAEVLAAREETDRGDHQAD